MLIDERNKDKLPKEITDLCIKTDKDGMLDIPLYFKFSRDCATELVDYLNNKPAAEVDEYIRLIEACSTDPDLYIDYNGLMSIVTYLKTRCPRKEIIHIMDRIMGDRGDVQVYSIKNNNQE